MYPFGQQMPTMPMMGPFGVMNKMALAPALYVGDIDDTIQEEFLYDFFSKYGALHFVRIMRDHTSGKSRGYGFVNFINPRDAENAKQHAQYEKLGKKYIRIMFKRPIKDLSSDANIFVRNIDPSVTPKELHSHFSNNSAGGVLSVKIATNSEGKSLGYAYVQFEKPEDAAHAVNTLNGSQLKENQLHLSHFLPRDKRPVVPKKNIYVKYLPHDKTEAELNKFVESYFSKFGEIQTMVLKKHPTKDEYSAFICFEKQEAAENCSNTLKQNPPKLDGENPLYISWHQSKAERERELKREYAAAPNLTNLFIKNLKPEVTEQEVKQAFQNFGKVNSIAVKDWISKAGQKQAKFGFVAFDNPEDANKAINEGYSHDETKNLFIPGARAYIGLHQSKDKRQQFLLSERRRMQSSMQFGPDMFRGMQHFGGGEFSNRRFQAPPQMYSGQPNMFKSTFRRPAAGGQQGGHPRPDWGKGPNTGGPRNMAGGRPGQPRPPYQQQQQQHHQQGNVNPQQRMGQQQHPGKRPEPTQGGMMKQQQQQQKPQAAPQQSAITVQNLRSRLTEFLALDSDKQRQILGELLFPLIRAKSSPDHAPKITGMLIDLSVLEVTEILEFLEDEELLAERIEEAKILLNEGEA